MIRRATHIATLAATVLTAIPGAAQENAIRAEEWAGYSARFVGEDGRVIDDANGNISHSEGQGYGLVLAYLAGDRSTFERIWSFTRTELMLRDDGLAAWSWSPDADPHVTDINNATDGDILIAYGLGLAGEAWNRDDLTEAAASLAEAIGTLAYTQGERLLLPPGKTGYGRSDRSDGPVVNPSYWVYEAFPVLARLAPETDWAAISQAGLALLAGGLVGPRQLPPEWLSIAARPRAATGFDAVFGYNAIRIPLYLARAGVGEASLVEGLAERMRESDGTVAVVELETGAVKEPLADAGYRIIPAVADCLTTGTPIPSDLTTFRPTNYYPSTLHLLALSHVRTARPECLP